MRACVCICKEKFIALNVYIKQFSHSVVSNCLWPHGLQHARHPCPITSSWSLLKLMSIESVMPSNHFILCCPLSSCLQASGSFLMSVFFVSGGHNWSFSFSISPSNKYSGLISFRINWSDLFAVQGLFKSLLQHKVQKHQFLGAQLSLWVNSHIHTKLLEKPYLWLDRPLLAK